jgi:hypothetical protein
LDFWFACEGLKKQQNPDKINQLVKVIYRWAWTHRVLLASLLITSKYYFQHILGLPLTVGL